MCKLTFEALDFLVGVVVLVGVAVLVGVVVHHQLLSHRLFGKGFSSPFARTFVLVGGFPFSLLS